MVATEKADGLRKEAVTVTGCSGSEWCRPGRVESEAISPALLKALSS